LHRCLHIANQRTSATTFAKLCRPPECVDKSGQVDLLYTMFHTSALASSSVDPRPENCTHHHQCTRVSISRGPRGVKPEQSWVRINRIGGSRRHCSKCLRLDYLERGKIIERPNASILLSRCSQKSYPLSLRNGNSFFMA